MTGITFHVQANVLISEQFMSDVMQTAFGFPGGGSWLWSETMEAKLTGRDGGPATGEGSDIWYAITIKNRETGREHFITHHMVSLGLREIMRGTGTMHHQTVLKAAVEDDASEIDSEIADHIIQHAIWGEVRYSA